jgi:hypothetical protein
MVRRNPGMRILLSERKNPTMFYFIAVLFATPILTAVGWIFWPNLRAFGSRIVGALRWLMPTLFLLGCSSNVPVLPTLDAGPAQCTDPKDPYASCEVNVGFRTCSGTCLPPVETEAGAVVPGECRLDSSCNLSECEPSCAPGQVCGLGCGETVGCYTPGGAIDAGPNDCPSCFRESAQDGICDTTKVCVKGPNGPVCTNTPSAYYCQYGAQVNPTECDGPVPGVICCIP